MIRNEKLGNVTRLVMSLLDYKTPCDLSLASEMHDSELTFEDLRANKPFLIGVMSGFFMEEPIEKWFLSKVDTGVDMPYQEPVLEVTHEEEDIEDVSEGVDAMATEVPVEEGTVQTS